MRVTLVNHASVIFEAAGVRLLTDPWIEGPAFHHGWELLVKTPFCHDDFASITHLWLSHEHPDHFSPPNIKAIPEGIRRQITVLYQKTQDRKVIDFCARLGMKTEELPPRRWIELAPGFRVYSEAVPFYDSWLAIKAENKTIVNLNDCELNTPERLRAVRRQTGAVDLLLSQFSYANWSQDPPRLAARVLDRLVLQARALDARWTIPFASFIRFCHAENQPLNSAINTVSAAERALSASASGAPVVLYPGDSWELGELHDNTRALGRWRAAYEAIPEMPLRSSAPVSLVELERQGVEYLARVRVKNNPLFIAAGRLGGLFPEVVIYLRDLDQTVTFDLRRGLSRSALPRESADIAMESECLSFALRFDYGPDTLYVNGRVQTTEGGMNRFMKAFSLGVLNNTGRRFGPGLAIDPVFLRQAPAILSQFLRGGSRLLRHGREEGAPSRR